MKLIEDTVQYLHIKQSVDIIIDRRKELPMQVFANQYNNFLFINFDDIFMVSFFKHIQCFLKKIGEYQFNFATIKPDPEDYYYKHFKKYNAISFTVNNKINEFICAINDDPGKSKADAIIHNTDKILVYSNSLGWAIYGERELEIAICAFKCKSVMKLFAKSYGNDLLSNINEVLNLMGSAYRTGIVPLDIENSFRRNYSMRNRKGSN